MVPRFATPFQSFWGVVKHDSPYVHNQLHNCYRVTS